MKNFLISLIISLLFVSSALARSTGCKEGNCENGFGKWVYTDKTTYEGEWVDTKKNEKIYILYNLKFLGCNFSLSSKDWL